MKVNEKKIDHSRLVAFGDSITEGIGVPEGSRKWTEIIQERFKLDLINSGIAGNTSSQGLERIEEDVLKYHPDFVTICFGMNDHYMTAKDIAKVDIQLYEKNIVEMVERIREISAIPILITANYIIEGNENEYYYARHNPSYYEDVESAQAWLDKYMEVVRMIAKKLNVELIDIRKECEKYDKYDFLRSLNNDVVDDGVHPHSFGALIYAQTIGDYLEDNY